MTLEMKTEYKGIPLENVEGIVHQLRMFALQSIPKIKQGARKLEWEDYFDHLTKVHQSLQLAERLEYQLHPTSFPWEESVTPNEELSDLG